MKIPGVLAAAALAGGIAAACGGGSSEPESPTAILAGPTRAATATATAEATRTATPVPPTATAAPTEAPATAVPATAPAQPGSGTGNPTPPPPPPTQAPRPSEASFTVTADANKFDRASIRVAAGASVTATLQNNEAGVAHNLSFSLPGLPHGETCTGPCSATQTFKAEKAGSYYFLCTLHDMVGTFVVDP